MSTQIRNCFKNGSRPRKPLENRHFAWFLKQSLRCREPILRTMMRESHFRFLTLFSLRDITRLCLNQSTITENKPENQQKNRKYQRGSWGCPGLHDTRCRRRLRPRGPALLAHWLSIARASVLPTPSRLRVGGTAGTELRADERISLRASSGR